MTPGTIVVAVALSSHACSTCTWPVSGLASMSAIRPPVPPTSQLPSRLGAAPDMSYAYTIDEPFGWSLPSMGSVPRYSLSFAASNAMFHAPKLSTGIVPVARCASYAGTGSGDTGGRSPRSTLPSFIAPGSARSIPTK